MALDDEQWSRVQSTIATAAYLGWRRYRAYLSLSDARQEATIWCLEHPAKVEEFVADEDRGLRRLQSRLVGVVVRSGRAEKASQSGYRSEDEVFYSLGVLEALMPVLWRGDYRPWQPAEEAGRTKKGGQTYLEYETMVMDLKGAWDRAQVTTEEQAILGFRYRDGLLLTQIAKLYEVSEGTIRNRIKSGLRAIQAELGGAPPPTCPNGCECEQTGTRKLVGPAEAIAISSRNYDE